MATGQTRMLLLVEQHFGKVSRLEKG